MALCSDMTRSLAGCVIADQHSKPLLDFFKPLHGCSFFYQMFSARFRLEYFFQTSTVQSVAV